MCSSKQYWESRFDGLNPENYDFSQSKPLTELVDFCHKHLHPGETVLDLACGGGRNSHFLAESGYQVYGVDFSESAIEFCRKRFSRFSLPGVFKVGSMDHIPFPDRSFGAVFCIAAIDHVRYEAAQKAIGEMRRVLKPEKLMLLTFDPLDTDQDIADQAELLDDRSLNFIKGEHRGLIFHPYIDNEIRTLVGNDNITVFEYLEDGSRLVVSR
ncbi:MAG: hypothetical protein APR63_02805 [Desulfuromonas sp. SDB]|nr:MAG: hypothetical protein APR63_02805 [Desulfuromonas sp. SDB]